MLLIQSPGEECLAKLEVSGNTSWKRCKLSQILKQQQKFEEKEVRVSLAENPHEKMSTLEEHSDPM